MCAKHATYSGQRGLLLHYIHYRLISVIYRLGEWCVSWGRDNDSADKDVLEWCDVGVTRPGKMTLKAPYPISVCQ